MNAPTELPPLLDRNSESPLWAQFRDALRLQVAALAVAGAEKILQAEIDAAKHAGMLNQLATELK